MSEREQEGRETLADIADEIRRAVESMGDEIPYTVSAGTMRRVADRIKAAAKREKAEIEADALAVGGVVEAARHKECGTPTTEKSSALPRKGKWENGTKYEYEYAYCSECGRMQWAGWDTHKQAKENIESFAHDYKFCPGCGAEMVGGVYVK